LNKIVAAKQNEKEINDKLNNTGKVNVDKDKEEKNELKGLAEKGKEREMEKGNLKRKASAANVGIFEQSNNKNEKPFKQLQIEQIDQETNIENYTEKCKTEAK